MHTHLAARFFFPVGSMPFRHRSSLSYKNQRVETGREEESDVGWDCVMDSNGDESYEKTTFLLMLTFII